ncbi:MAG: 2-isopropylmalate synthase [Canidatus Methanoxibalbensis ujae]|nr:2-isopropylmalate synthase [Candidatus Methanoxibalbensis ujae]MCW7078506.1 2-isopropylmalate synthase [Candidatus Methanoxibalbensis ujae]
MSFNTYAQTASDAAGGSRYIEIFDTTLRDGEQTPGISFTNEQKMRIALQLDRLGVDVIEAGFPVSAPEEKDIVRNICKSGLNAKVCGLARVLTDDIDACIECGVDIVHIFVSTSEIQRKYTTKMSDEQVKDVTYEMVRYVKEHGCQCMFSAMDATRTELEFLIDVFRVAEEAGADILNIPDTVGISEPFSMFKLVSAVHDSVKVPLSVHCHNDFGLAVANSLAAVKAGVSQVQVTVNGIGERAGNADLSETVMSLVSIYRFRTGIKTELLFETAKLVERFTGIHIPANKPIVGENAFSHESGIHAHGVLERSDTFEPGIMTPEMVGHRRRIVLGKHTGRHSIEQKLTEFGIHPTKEQLEEILSRVKKLGASGKLVTDDDLFSIAEILTEISGGEQAVKLKELAVMTGNNTLPTASLRVEVRGKDKKLSRIGVGPVDAAIKAIQDAISDELGGDVRLKDFRIEAITGGSDALAEVIVGVEHAGKIVTARGVREDIVLASVEAFINAVNRLLLMQHSAEHRS